MTHCIKFGLVLAVAITLAASACGGGDEDYGPDKPEDTTPDPITNSAPVPPPTQLNCPTATYLTYENFGQGFMANYCTSCHGAGVPDTARGGAPVDSNFDTAADVLVWRKLIMDRTGVVGAAGSTPVTTGAKMPPSAHITAADLVSFTEWMNCGAPVGSTHD